MAKSSGRVVSAEVHCVKPEPKIYELLLEKYHLQPEETVFIDDLEDNLEAARKLGIQTIHFTDVDSVRKQFEDMTQKKEQ